MAAAPIAARKPRVLIVGTKPNHHAAIEREFGGKARLRFFYWENLHELKDRSKNVDRVFVMTSSINHKAYNILRAHAPRGSMHHVSGAASSLKEALGTYLAQLQPPKGEGE